MMINGIAAKRQLIILSHVVVLLSHAMLLTRENDVLFAQRTDLISPNMRVFTAHIDISFLLSFLYAVKQHSAAAARRFW